MVSQNLLKNRITEGKPQNNNQKIFADHFHIKFKSFNQKGHFLKSLFSKSLVLHFIF